MFNWSSTGPINNDIKLSMWECTSIWLTYLSSQNVEWIVSNLSYIIQIQESRIPSWEFIKPATSTTSVRFLVAIILITIKILIEVKIGNGFAVKFFMSTSYQKNAVFLKLSFLRRTNSCSPKWPFDITKASYWSKFHNLHNERKSYTH